MGLAATCCVPALAFVVQRLVLGSSRSVNDSFASGMPVTLAYSASFLLGTAFRAPVPAALSFRHSVDDPLAPTVNMAEPPTATRRSAGCAVMDGNCARPSAAANRSNRSNAINTLDADRVFFMSFFLSIGSPTPLQHWGLAREHSASLSKAWRRFLAHRLMVVSLVVLIVIHLLVFIGPFFWTVRPEATNALNGLAPITFAR